MDMIWEFTNIGGYVVKPDSTVEVAETDEGKQTMKATSSGFCPDAALEPADLVEAECYDGVVSYDQELRAALVVYKRTCEFKARLFAPGPETITFGWPFKFTFASELG